MTEDNHTGSAARNTTSKKSSYERLWETAKRYLALKSEDLKLTASEKITVLLSTLIVCIVVTVLCAAILLFLTFAAANWIGESLGLAWAYLIIAGCYAILVGLVFLMRKPLIIDPVSRFITKVILS